MLNLYKWLPNLIEQFTLYGSGKGGKAPAAPDYTAAAQATAQGNLEAAKVAAAANRVNQITPYGTLTYTQNPSQGSFDQAGYDRALQQYQQQLSQYNSSKTNTPAYSRSLAGIGGQFNIGNMALGSRAIAPIAPDKSAFYNSSGPDTYTATTTLSPDQQAILEKNTGLTKGFLDTATNALGQVGNAVAEGFDFSKLPAAQINAGQTVQDAIMSRLDPTFGKRQSALETQLANQGIARGTEAYTTAQRDLDNARNDAYIQAALQGIGAGQQARQQALQEQEFGRTEPINIINALRTGNQVQNPSFVSVPQQQTTAGPDLLGAANAQYQNQLSNYNAQQAAGGNFMGGLFSLGGAALGSPWAGKMFGF